jgi:DNA-binding YbaB/EbfC family protein
MGVTRFDADSTAQLRAIVAAGVGSFKVFLAYKGAFGVDDEELWRTLTLAKELGVVVTAHCENETLVAEMQAKLEHATVTGQSGGGLVKVTLSGKGAMTGIEIDPSLLKPEEKDILEDLISAAHADAKNKSEAMMAEEMKSVTGGLPLPPGFKLPF